MIKVLLRVAKVEISVLRIGVVGFVTLAVGFGLWAVKLPEAARDDQVQSKRPPEVATPMQPKLAASKPVKSRPLTKTEGASVNTDASLRPARPTAPTTCAGPQWDVLHPGKVDFPDCVQ
jgi:hypothetical protein